MTFGLCPPPAAPPSIAFRRSVTGDRAIERALDDRQATTPTDQARDDALIGWPLPRGRTTKQSSGWKRSFAIVALTWLAVGFLAVSIHPAAIERLLARGLEPLASAAFDTVAVPDDPGNEPGSLACNDVGTRDSARLTRAASLMQRTNEGRTLYQELIANDVCVTVRDLGYFAGLAIPRWTFGDWGHSTIEIDCNHLRTVDPDVLATTLVHEATHIDRSIQGTTCLDDDSCTVLDNGVELDEEVAAHAAEARWWFASYGRGGKTDPDPAAAWENALASAHLAGPDTFEDFVKSFRSNPKEAVGS